LIGVVAALEIFKIHFEVDDDDFNIACLILNMNATSKQFFAHFEVTHHQNDGVKKSIL
jgi:hypothetical protein